MEINDLSPAERRVWRAFPRGEAVDFREGADDDPVAGAGWGPGRTVRAEVLRALLLDGPRQDGEIAGLKLTGARVTGRLDLGYGTVDHPIRLRACHFERAPHLYGAHLRVLVFSDSAMPGVNAGAVRVDGVLRLNCCRIIGPVRLAGAQVSGALFLNGARLGDPEAPADADEPGPTAGAAEGPVLRLNHALIGADLWAVDLVAHGQIRLKATTVEGQVNLDRARLHAPGGTALHAENLSVGTDLRGADLRVDGRVDLRGATVPGQFDLTRARLSNPGGQALRASSCTIGELWLRDAEPIQGKVTLRRSQLDVLHLPPEVWSGRIRTDGLSYRTLVPHLPAARRLPLLERDADGYVPYAYEQLTLAYRTAGDEAAARTVQLAKLRRHRRTLPPYARIWGYLQDAAVGYGFRPMRAAGWLLALLLTGTLAFARRHPRPLKPEEAPDFDPLFYTLDLLLPIIGFGQESAFASRGWYQWLSYGLIVTGWILATTIAAGISRSLSRQ
ncbi:membrane-associated oxidoreductase [Streptomyces sp. LX-29]|uniref:membrane-associated oxidoreductase n=1 Tax=Streptomyces sp. LX-29 TaxID=2900152 RepID=UPI00240D47AC|nr:membrane-associated oxidoreductase [Streptomyces sp. LX-29]WFB05973.1 membrane-associated oxidoreductase [Streptomyces sp. LX-29]